MLKYERPYEVFENEAAWSQMRFWLEDLGGELTGKLEGGLAKHYGMPAELVRFHAPCQADGVPDFVQVKALIDQYCHYDLHRSGSFLLIGVKAWAFSMPHVMNVLPEMLRQIFVLPEEEKLPFIAGFEDGFRDLQVDVALSRF